MLLFEPPSKTEEIKNNNNINRQATQNTLASMDLSEETNMSEAIKIKSIMLKMVKKVNVLVQQDDESNVSDSSSDTNTSNSSDDDISIGGGDIKDDEQNNVNGNENDNVNVNESESKEEVNVASLNDKDYLDLVAYEFYLVMVYLILLMYNPLFIGKNCKSMCNYGGTKELKLDSLRNVKKALKTTLNIFININLLEFKARNTIQEILAELESNGDLGKDGVAQKNQ